MRAQEFETVPAKKILSYVKNIQGDGHFYMDDLITRYPRWQLTQVPLSKLKINPDPEIKNPLGTNIHIDLDYVDSISPQDIARKPIVVDPSGWIIDGNHRATAAQQQGLATIPAYVPVKDITENFADGKNPGRKGLAKRSGVNTKASVSSLRKTAKNSSGEKQRMAHWLANMKAGRAKARRK